jgi:hypothetical protein
VIEKSAKMSSDEARAYARAYRDAHKEEMIASAKAWRRVGKDFVDSLKTKCVKCEEDFPGVLEFHHVETKEFGLSYATRVKDSSKICTEAKENDSLVRKLP